MFPLILLMVLGMKNEKIRRATEKKTLKDNSTPQLPEVHTSLRAPPKKVKTKIPIKTPMAVPQKKSQKNKLVLSVLGSSLLI